MSPNFDYLSSLLCLEDCTSIFDEIDEHEASIGMLEEPWSPSDNQNQHFGDPIVWLPLQSKECLALMLEKECQYLPSSDYVDRLKNGDLDFVGRKEVICWIEKVRAHFGFGPLSVYLSINYLDRFLSICQSIRERTWTMQLLAVACLSLATKLEESEVPRSHAMQRYEARFVFEPKTIQRMEILIMGTLKWRMQAVTPFSFIDYFLCKLNEDEVAIGDPISQSSELILSTIRETDFIGFKPSEIAAAVAICVTGETETVLETENAVSLLIQYVEKDRVMKCVKMIQELSASGGSYMDTIASSSVPCMPQCPIRVLDALSFSFKTDDENTNVSSVENSTRNNSPDAKRSKLSNTTDE